MPIRLYQGTLSRDEEKQLTAQYAVCVIKPVPGSAKAAFNRINPSAWRDFGRLGQLNDQIMKALGLYWLKYRGKTVWDDLIRPSLSLMGRCNALRLSGYESQEDLSILEKGLLDFKRDTLQIGVVRHKLN